MPSTHPTIGAKIRYFRERRGWSLRDLGERSDIAFGLIGRWERRGADPSFGQAERIAKALEIPVDWLWDTKPAPGHHASPV